MRIIRYERWDDIDVEFLDDFILLKNILLIQISSEVK